MTIFLDPNPFNVGPYLCDRDITHLILPKPSSEAEAYYITAAFVSLIAEGMYRGLPKNRSRVNLGVPKRYLQRPPQIPLSQYAATYSSPWDQHRYVYAQGLKPTDTYSNRPYPSFTFRHIPYYLPYSGQFCSPATFHKFMQDLKPMHILNRDSEGNSVLQTSSTSYLLIPKLEIFPSHLQSNLARRQRVLLPT